MSIPLEHLRVEFERTATDLGLAFTTLGRMVGQGGGFHARLAAGKRMWPETAEAVWNRLQALRAEAGWEVSHAPSDAPAPAPLQGAPEEAA